MGEERNANYYSSNFSNTKKIRILRRENIYEPIYKKVITLIDFTKNPRILDIGCGTATFVNFLKEINYTNYTGVDFSDVIIKFSKKRFPEYNFICENITTSSFLKKTFRNFDIFVGFEVLEHIHADLQIISEIPEGKELIFSIPNFDCVSHVRYFKDFNQIKKRYSKLLNIDDSNMFEFKLNDIQTFFLIKSTRSS
jgi:2-polyprenyl-3-methyl-5-hydroxy-6-metoxy-1,4-benzoquinol methylase